MTDDLGDEGGRGARRRFEDDGRRFGSDRGCRGVGMVG